MFVQKYRVNYTISYDGGATFHPRSKIITARSAFNAKLRVANDYPKFVVNVHTAVEVK